MHTIQPHYSLFSSYAHSFSEDLKLWRHWKKMDIDQTSKVRLLQHPCSHVMAIINLLYQIPISKVNEEDCREGLQLCLKIVPAAFSSSRCTAPLMHSLYWLSQSHSSTHLWHLSSCQRWVSVRVPSNGPNEIKTLRPEVFSTQLFIRNAILAQIVKI